LQINEAYEILTDVAKRTVYDLYGDEGLEDLKKQKNLQRGKDIESAIFFTLEEIYAGATKVYSFRRTEICKTCKGTGDKSAKLGVCQVCGGAGTVNQRMNMGGMVFNMHQPCQACRGSGRSGSQNCPVCRGNRVNNKMKSLEVQVSRGANDGDVITFRGESEQLIETYPGDVHIKVRVKRHDRFEREGDNLRTSLRVSLKDAILGFRKTIKHLDGRDVVVMNDETTQNGQVLRVRGEGMPLQNDPSQFGDLFVRVFVDFPRAYTPDQL
jgi:DnaJ-class molecular chaperone